MIVRRKTWTYRLIDSITARSMTFNMAVTKATALKLITKHHRKLVAEIWAI